MTTKTHEKLFDDIAEGKLSNLIRLAVEDLEFHENSPCFLINMSVWHNAYSIDSFMEDSDKGSICNVCFAGSTMYRSGIKKHQNNPPMHHRDWPAWYALNDIRTGEVSYGANRLDLDKTLYVKFNRIIVEYEDNPELFKQQMLELADDLEADGL